MARLSNEYAGCATLAYRVDGAAHRMHVHPDRMYIPYQTSSGFRRCVIEVSLVANPAEVALAPLEATSRARREFRMLRYRDESGEIPDDAMSRAVRERTALGPPNTFGGRVQALYITQPIRSTCSPEQRQVGSGKQRTPAYIALPDTASGMCPNGTIPVYRLWNGRADSNHCYTSDPTVKAQMIAKGYVAEGYGPNAVGMCALQ